MGSLVINVCCVDETQIHNSSSAIQLTTRISSGHVLCTSVDEQLELLIDDV